MAFDKYNAVWVSHSSMGDFLKCPKAYYLHNVYKDPKTNRKMNIVGPAMSLGLAVHTVLEDLNQYPTEGRLNRDLLADFEKAWDPLSGKIGGFVSAEEETEAKERGKKMIERVIANPGPLSKKTVKLKPTHNNMPPNIILSEEDSIILCGLVDWLEYHDEDDSISIVDFKTGKHEEADDSLQLPIYLLLLSELQKRHIRDAKYWYLEYENEPVVKSLPSIEEAKESVLKVAREVKKVRQNRQFICPRGEEGCFACRPYEKILRGEAEFVGVGGYGQDLYVVKSEDERVKRKDAE